MPIQRPTLASSIKSLIIATMLFLAAVSVLMVFLFHLPEGGGALPPQPCRTPLLSSTPGLLILGLFFAGSVTIILLLFRLLRQYRRRQEALERERNTNPLTGLYNKAAFERALGLEVSRASRYQMPFSLTLFDLDGLKMINDFFGREGGDFVLHSVAEAVRGLIRDVDTLYYVENGTFALILPSTGLSGAFILAERLRHALTQLTWEYGGREIAVTASFGVSGFQAGSDTPPLLYSRVENLVFKAKKSGRNRVC